MKILLILNRYCRGRKQTGDFWFSAFLPNRFKKAYCVFYYRTTASISRYQPRFSYHEHFERKKKEKQPPSREEHSPFFFSTLVIVKITVIPIEIIFSLHAHACKRVLNCGAKIDLSMCAHLVFSTALRNEQRSQSE